MSTETLPTTTTTTKDRVRQLLKSLPDNCTLEDVQYGLYVLQKIQNGEEQIERGEGIPHEVVKERFQKWLAD
jgi:predicted transcriptional regulator of viral defense system